MSTRQAFRDAGRQMVPRGRRAQHQPDPRGQRRRPRAAGVLVALLMGLGLSSCHPAMRPAENIQIYVSAGAKRDRVAQASLQHLLGRIAQDYMQINPGVNLHLRVVHQGELLDSVRQRAALGASPDLMISRVGVGYALHQEGLSVPTGFTPAQLAPLRVRFLEKFVRENQVLILPLVAQPSVACYDRDRMPKPPRTLAQLVALASGGDRIGLSLQVEELVWSATGFGAQEALLRMLHTTPTKAQHAVISDEERRKIVRWIRWLQSTNAAQANVTFLESEDALVSQLLRGKLDWISCQGSSITRLQQGMGRRLGVSLLPTGPNGEQTRAMARIISFSFGRDSTANQRRIAQHFALFALDQFVQNNLVMESFGNLPVNQNVRIPKKESAALAALEQSLNTALVPDFSSHAWVAGLIPLFSQQLKLAIYGEATPEATAQELQNTVQRLVATPPAKPTPLLQP